MPVTLHCESFALTTAEAALLWRAVTAACAHADDEVAVRCVDEAEIIRLNTQYRNVSTSTNILTFSYGGAHDIALCTHVAQREADARGALERDYYALLLTHAFLHACGKDHEASFAAEREMLSFEKTILSENGFTALTWYE